jgi:serine/threonine protein kinase
MPPEQIKGKATPASDLYALGCTLYFLLAGKDPEALAVASLKSEETDVSSEFDTLITRLTALDVKDRPCPKELINELEKLSPNLMLGSSSRPVVRGQ